MGRFIKIFILNSLSISMGGKAEKRFFPLCRGFVRLPFPFLGSNFSSDPGVERAELEEASHIESMAEGEELICKVFCGLGDLYFGARVRLVMKRLALEIGGQAGLAAGGLCAAAGVRGERNWGGAHGLLTNG